MLQETLAVSIKVDKEIFNGKQTPFPPTYQKA